MYRYKVKSVKRVIDGDTVDLEIDLGFNIVITQRVRLKGINAPETRTLDLAEKALGNKAKTWLTEQLGTFSSLIIETTREDKYGRVLGVLYKDNETISMNELMLKEGLVVSYMVD